MKKIYILSEAIAKADSKKEERKTDSRDIDRSGGKQVKTDNVDNAGLV